MVNKANIESPVSIRETIKRYLKKEKNIQV